MYHNATLLLLLFCFLFPSFLTLVLRFIYYYYLFLNTILLFYYLSYCLLFSIFITFSAKVLLLCLLLSNACPILYVCLMGHIGLLKMLIHLFILFSFLFYHNKITLVVSQLHSNVTSMTFWTTKLLCILSFFFVFCFVMNLH